MADPRGPRIAIVHDYLTQRGGAERVVLAMAHAFPDAQVHTTFYDAEATYPALSELDVRVSWLNRWGWLRRHHRAAMPIMAWLVRRRIRDVDVVIASSSGWAHGWRHDGRMIAYCHTPARWLYQGDRYLGHRPSLVTSLGLAVLSPWLRRWDRRAARRAERYLVNSTVVRERVREQYGREATVVMPPQVLSTDTTPCAIPELDAFTQGEAYWLCVSRLLVYKNVDVVIDAFNRTGRRLVVVGAGPLAEHLRDRAGDSVLFLDSLSETELHEVYRRARGLVAASYEDFGLTPVEAAAHGKPSVVLRWGGYLDSMVEDVTAVFFDELTPEALADAVEDADARVWDTQAIVDHADSFSEQGFIERLRAEVAALAPSVEAPERRRDTTRRQPTTSS